MSKELITRGEARNILILFILGSTMLLGTARQAQTDSWISILLAMVMIIPIYLIIARLLSLFPGQNLFGNGEKRKADAKCLPHGHFACIFAGYKGTEL